MIPRQARSIASGFALLAFTAAVTAGTPERHEGTFDLVLDGAGATVSVEFTTPGVDPYFCARHSQIRGEVRIQ